MEAGATEIKVELFKDTQLAMTDLSQKICGFSILDNGHGFTRKNIEAFEEFWTDNKIEHGCKGSGRFAWLTVFNKIEIESNVSKEKFFTKDYDASDSRFVNICNNEGVYTKFIFNINFEQGKTIQPIESNNIDTFTKLTFSDVTKLFYDPNDKKPYDNRESINIKQLADKVKEHLIIKLFLMREKGDHFNIEFKCGENKVYISHNDIPNFEKVDFVINKDVNDKELITGREYEFTLYYSFVADKSNMKNVWYCANFRTVQKMNSDDLGFSTHLPNKDSLTMLLKAEYLDEQDDDSRNELSGLKNQDSRNFLVPLLMTDIKFALKKQMHILIRDRYVEIDDINKQAEEDAIAEFPHLASFIKDNNEIVKSKKSLTTAAKKKFADRKEQVKNRFDNVLVDKSIDSEAFYEAVIDVSDIALVELGEYILYRDSVIKGLEKVVFDKDKREEHIHNIFMPKSTRARLLDVDKHKLSNLWLFDDKFMTYAYVASDVQIKSIIADIKKENNKRDVFMGGKEPDLSIFYNKPDGRKNAVFVEFKGSYATLGEKEKAPQELKRNIGIIKRNLDDIDSLWGYIVTTIDEEFSQSLEDGDFIKLFTNDDEGKIFYNYNKNNNAHIFVIDTRTIIKDAFSRNSTFLDLLKNK